MIIATVKILPGEEEEEGYFKAGTVKDDLKLIHKWWGMKQGQDHEVMTGKLIAGLCLCPG